MKMMITSMEQRREMMRKGMVVTKIFSDMMKAEKMLYMVGKIKMPDMVVKMPDKMKKIKMLDMVKKIKMPEKWNTVR
jgi:hypothetical protein